MAALTFFVARKWGTRPWFTAALAFLAVTSHGLLDAMTYRTRGVPFYWPLTDVRFTFPWRHIPPAPVGTHFFSQRGLEVAAVEFVYFLPITIASLLPSRVTLRRWFGRVTEPLRMVPSRFTRRASTRIVAAVGLTVLSMAFANRVLRDSRLVSWIERSTDQGVAVSVMTRPQFRHYH